MLFSILETPLTGSAQYPEIVPELCEYHPLEVQYHLFQTWWRTMLNLELYRQYSLHVFTIYEEEAIDLEFLIGQSPLCSRGIPLPYKRFSAGVPNIPQELLYAPWL